MPPIPCEGVCALSNIFRKAVVRRNGTPLCADCAEDFPPSSDEEILETTGGVSVEYMLNQIHS